MNLYEAIFVRKSVRSYTGEAINPQTLDKLKSRFRELTGLFGGIETDMVILDNRKGQQRMLSLFSVRAPYYLVFYSAEAPRYLMNMGYLMEQMVLYMCSIGIGTCYIGSNKIKRSFRPGTAKKWWESWPLEKHGGSHVRKQAEAKRLSLEQLCVFKEVPRQWMRQLLDAARLSPSSLNSQPWRFVVYDNRIHIFSRKHKAEQLKKWDEVNFGIMFANLMTAAEEMWLDVT